MWFGRGGRACSRRGLLSPVTFAVDTVVPIIDLKQRAIWYPANDTVGWWMNLWLNLATVAGWLLSTVFALSLTRFGRAS